jgi:hypothetical protein
MRTSSTFLSTVLSDVYYVRLTTGPRQYVLFRGGLVDRDSGIVFVVERVAMVRKLLAFRLLRVYFRHIHPVRHKKIRLHSTIMPFLVDYVRLMKNGENCLIIASSYPACISLYLVLLYKHRTIINAVSHLKSSSNPCLHAKMKENPEAYLVFLEREGTILRQYDSISK